MRNGIAALIFTSLICWSSNLWAQLPPMSGGGEIDLTPEQVDALRGTAGASEFQEAVENLKEEAKGESEGEGETAPQEKEKEEEQELLALQRNRELPDAAVWGQQFFRNQSITLFTDAARNRRALNDYLLDVGDEISLTIWGPTNYSQSMLVDEEGFIDLSMGMYRIPRLYVKNMTFSDARKAIVERMSRHSNIKRSGYSIQLNYSRTINVNIVGEVFTPGSYTIQATNTAFNALVAAGGPSQLGSIRKIRVSSGRGQSEDKVLDVYKYILDPEKDEEFFLYDNDYIYVPLAGRVVKIEGAIKRPHSYELIEGENLLDLINYAGGLQADAYTVNIKIKRFENDQELLLDVNLADLLDRKKDLKLLDGDIISIEPIGQPYSNFVEVNGAVKLPGEYALQDSTRLAQVLAKAGVLSSARLDKAYLKRTRPDFTTEYVELDLLKVLTDSTSSDNLVLRPMDRIEIKTKSDFIDEFSIRLDGEVRQPGSFDYSDNLSLADLIYMGGGIKPSASSSRIEVSRMERIGERSVIVIEEIAIGDSLEVADAETFILRPFDQVFVRRAGEYEEPRNVSIAGEVRYPGVYTLKKRDERLFDVLRRAGLLTEVASVSGAKLLRSKDNTGPILLDLEEVLEDRESKYNYLLRDGDRIIIPRVRDLVSISGAVNHSFIQEQNEIGELELEIELAKLETEIERKELILERTKTKERRAPKVNVPYHKNKNAMFYIREYGAGIDRVNRGRRRLVYVRYDNGLVRRTRSFLFFHKYPKVETGAMVFVDTKPIREKQPSKRNREPINWGKVFSDTIAQLTAAVTLYLLIFNRATGNNNGG